MGSDALLSSGVTAKILYLIRDPRARSPTDPLNTVRKSRIALFTLVELIGFGATFAITQVRFVTIDPTPEAAADDRPLRPSGSPL